jgi:protein-tyrosine phosphatase
VGNYAREGMIPSLDARNVLREVGFLLAEDAFASTDLRQHRDVVADADLILTMTDDQKRTIAAFAECNGTPVYTLREFSGESGDIGDPATLGEDVFRSCRDEIAACLERSVERLLQTLASSHRM